MTVISTQYASGIVAATEKAAIASSKLIGLGDEKAADQVAVDAMRTALNAIDFAEELLLVRVREMKRLCFILARK